MPWWKEASKQVFLTGGGYSFTGFKAADLHWLSPCVPSPGKQNSMMEQERDRTKRKKSGALMCGFE